MPVDALRAVDTGRVARNITLRALFRHVGVETNATSLSTMAAVALLPSWRSAAYYSLPLSAGRSNALLPTFSRYLSPILAIPTLQSLMDLLPPFLLAVPKKKVSHSRKAMRAANKGLKDKTSGWLLLRLNLSSLNLFSVDIVNCPGCGTAKLAHHLCPACYSSASRRWKAQQKTGTAVGLGTSLDIPTVEA